jgi:hypothetical protein
MGGGPFRCRDVLARAADRGCLSCDAAKFLAPSLSLPVALDVGRQTFYVFNKVEWVLVAVLLLMLLNGGSIWLRILGIIAGLLVIV